MDAKKEKMSGSSDARKRQGGGTVPAPPRSRAEHKSGYGLPTVLSASGVGAVAIAEEKDRDKEEGMEVSFEERTGERKRTKEMEEDEGSTV